jgi:regulator of nucleoside diphosphate kinase
MIGDTVKIGAAETGRGADAGAPPPIAIDAQERDRLLTLCANASGEAMRVAPMLEHEIARAEVHRVGLALAGVARMHSIVRFADGRSERTVLIVYPHEADPQTGRVSILSELGAGLIGLQAGQTIHWPPGAGARRLRVVQVRGPDRLSW